MSHTPSSICIRKFRPQDAGFCYQLRKDAFLKIFITEIGEEAAQAGANAYQPADFILITQKKHCFILEKKSEKLGFFIISFVDTETAELFLIYLEDDQRGQGLGKLCMDFIDDWVISQCPTIRTIFVDTVIPEYNGGFYQRMGYQKLTKTECRFPNRNIPAIRYQKNLK